MPRSARLKSESGIYHVMLRGINKQTIFEDEEDCEKFIRILEDSKGKSSFKLYGYCLMGNHMHLLIKEEKEPMGIIFRRIGARYVYWYNRKYNRSGHLFEDRYKSEPVENDVYFLSVLRYIHQNPVKAGLAMTADMYNWSSHNDYIRNCSDITDIDFGLDILSDDRNRSIKIYDEFMNRANDGSFLEIRDDPQRITDDDLITAVRNKFGISAAEIQNTDTAKQLEIIRWMKARPGGSLRQISRITGITLNKIFRS